MNLKLTKNSLDSVCQLVKDYMREGKTLEVFLTDCNLSKKEWDKYLRKNRALQDALDDGLIYYKAFWQKKLDRDIYKRRANSTIAKMAFENALGWTEEAAKRQKINEKRPRFKLILDLGPDDEEEDEDKKTRMDKFTDAVKDNMKVLDKMRKERNEK